jgi:hypothetical protein
MDWLPDVGLEGVLVTALIGLIFAGVAAIFFVIGWINLRRARASQPWPRVLGRVVEARGARYALRCRTA